ncbi:hypothetical protein ACIB24_01150 [Spongisporangium articulatum]|uniref:Uncharacterized protein n=1 Tax=Spongisporangium articulatum TaxID=3362603 RepID=A0ABW8AH35_9ACTN
MTPLRLAVALDGCPEADLPALVEAAERARLDFVTLPASATDLGLRAKVGLLITRADDVRRLELEPAPGAGGPGTEVRACVVGDDPAEAVAEADIAFTVVATPEQTPPAVSALRELRAGSPRPTEKLLVFADLRLGLGTDLHLGTADDGLPLLSGPAAGLASRLQGWQRTGLDGFRVRADGLDELEVLTRAVIPALLENDAFRRGYESKTLRGVLGLPPARVEATA